MPFWYFIITGICTGFFSGLFGVGGGVILVPILVLVFHFPQATAGAISMVSIMLLPVGALGILQYYRAGKIELTQLKYGLLIACGIFFGAYFGAKVASNLDGAMLQRLFAVLLFIISLRLAFAN